MALAFLDTNIIIEYIKNRDKDIVNFVNNLEKIYINDVVIMELFHLT